jgi:tetratricopeptide (TPR) repeat protein
VGAAPTPSAAGQVARGHALLQAAEGLLSSGRTGQAIEAARDASDIFRGVDPLGVSRALALWAEAEEITGDTERAAEHIQLAISTRRQIAPDEIPLKWYEIAARIAAERADLDVAESAYAEAERHLRRRLRANESPALILSLCAILRRRAAVRCGRGDLAGATAAALDAVELARRLYARGATTEALSEVSAALMSLGDVQARMGQLVSAAAAFEETVALQRHLRDRAGDGPGALRDLSIALNRLGMVRAAGGEVEAAAAAFEEALHFRRAIHDRVGDTPQALRDLSSSLRKLAGLRLDAGDYEGAIDLVQAALDYEERLSALRAGGRGEHRPESLRESEFALSTLLSMCRRLAEPPISAVAARADLSRRRALRLLAEIWRARGDVVNAQAAEDEAARQDDGGAERQTG